MVPLNDPGVNRFTGVKMVSLRLDEILVRLLYSLFSIKYDCMLRQTF